MPPVCQHKPCSLVPPFPSMIDVGREHCLRSFQVPQVHCLRSFMSPKCTREPTATTCHGVPRSKSGKDRTALELAQGLAQDAVEGGHVGPQLRGALVRDLQGGLSYMQTGACMRACVCGRACVRAHGV